MNARQDDPTGKCGEWSAYGRLLGYARPYSKQLCIGLAGGLAYAGAYGGLVWMIRDGIQKVVSLEKTRFLDALLFAAVFPLLGLLAGLGEFASSYYVKWVGNRVITDLRSELFDRLQRLSLPFFRKTRTGELISRVLNDTAMVESSVSTVITDLARSPFTLAVMIVTLFVLDWRLTLFSLILFPVCVVPVVLFARRVRRHTSEAQKRLADGSSVLQEAVAGARIVRGFGMEEHEKKRFDERNESFFRRVMRVAIASAAVSPIMLALATTGVALVLAYVCWTKMVVGDFFAYLAALFFMYGPVKHLGKIHLGIQQSSAAADRVFEILDEEIEVKDRPGAETFDGEVRTLEFRDVEFSYGGEPVLKGLSFKVDAGRRIAIVGGSGVGKTTAVDLIPRFFDVTGGAILLNGRDIRDYTLKSLRGLIGLVTQETFLFHDTVAENIRYGTPGATMDGIEHAARLAHAHEFIMRMPNGYESVIGERGEKLSGGQRQRIAIARAALRNPPILILDEATSALDTESERMVQAALDELMRGRTVFAIAHRLSTIRNCDVILVFDAGRVAEQGTHDSLIAANGIYKRLYDLQFEKANP